MKPFRDFARASVLVLAAFIPLSAGAQVIPSTFPTKMPDLSPMHFLMGSWNCTMPGQTGSIKFSSTMDGMWMLGEGRTGTSSSGGMKTAYIYMTYDPAMSRWVWMNTQSTGGYGVLYSPGWQGNTMQWQGEVSGHTGGMTMTRMSDTVLRLTQNVPDATGHQQTQTFTCQKAM
jgi:hypothetical protein